LYQERIDAVQTRLNKKTGSYVKVGDKIKEGQNITDMVTENNNYIAEINTLL
jgi:Na+-translocating ferredoxin:NAD+ oxidoreductase RnfC subunit